jgi:uncharacterized protein (TIGR02246 family)
MSKPEIEEIRKLIEHRLQAIRAKDVEGSSSMMTPDYLVFDVIEPLRSSGAKAASNRAKEWFDTFRGPIGYEIQDLQIAADSEIAFSHGLNHVSATKIDGNPLDMWWRSTVCYRKIDGAWHITHEHNSVPFNVTNGKASLGLKP